MSNVKLATGPVSWGVDFADSPGNPPWQNLVDELCASGLTAMELGPLGYLPEDPQTLRDELARRNIVAVGSFIFDDLHDRGRAENLVRIAERTAAWIAGGGGKFLVIIDRPGPERMATAGRSGAARRLSTSDWSAMLDVIKRIADIAQSHGLVPTVHPHAGGYIEYRDEIEALLDGSDLSLCLDTGHLAYAGMVPEEAISTYSSRLKHLHLKDTNPVVLERVRVEQFGFWDAIAAQIFCPLGSGMVDLERVGQSLHAVEYSGFATIELDRVPGSGAPLDDLNECIAALYRAGIGAAAGSVQAELR